MKLRVSICRRSRTRKSTGLRAIKDLERFLRDVGGLSNGLAKAITARAKVILGAREAHEETNAKAMQELKAMFDRIAGHIALR